MRYFKSKLTLTMIVISTSCLAISKPATCPTVAVIKSVGVRYAGNSLAGWQVASDKNHFGTEKIWNFGMLLGGDDSPNETAAIASGNNKISSLVLYSGPQKINGKWECHYIIPNEDIDHHTIAIAVTEKN